MLRFKKATKLAGFLMQVLEKEAVEKAAARCEPPRLLAGDAVEVKTKPPGLPETATQVFRGVVLRVKNRGISSSVLLINNVRGDVVEQSFPLYSPWVQEIKVLQRAFIKKGKGRVKQARIYWLRDKDPQLFTVPMDDVVRM